MTQLTQTIEEARDHILKRIGALGDSTYEALVLEIINQSTAFINGLHDWNYLLKKDTFTTSDATGIVTLAADLDRVIAMYETGADLILTYRDTIPFIQLVLGEGVETPTYWTVTGYTQNDTMTAPQMNIEIHSAPASGSTYNIWYIKHLDEKTSGQISHVPNIPPSIWDLVLRKATLECLKITEAPPTVITTEERHLINTIDLCKKREHLGGSKQSAFGLPANVINYIANRGA